MASVVKPYYQDGLVTIYHANCGEVLSELRSESVDAVISDVPYGVQYAEWDGDLPSQQILNECLRIATGQVVWFGAAPKVLEFARYDPQPDRMLIWTPRFTLSHTGGNGYSYRWHPIAIWRIVKQKAIAWDVLDDPTECGNWWFHPATKPLSLMSKLVGTASGVILDPFMGSGTTLRAAKDAGLSAIGIEIEEEYCEIAAERMRQESLLALMDNGTSQRIDRRLFL